MTWVWHSDNPTLQSRPTCQEFELRKKKVAEFHQFELLVTVLTVVYSLQYAIPLVAVGRFIEGIGIFIYFYKSTHQWFFSGSHNDCGVEVWADLPRFVVATDDCFGYPRSQNKKNTGMRGIYRLTSPESAMTKRWEWFLFDILYLLYAKNMGQLAGYLLLQRLLASKKCPRSIIVKSPSSNQWLLTYQNHDAFALLHPPKWISWWSL